MFKRAAIPHSMNIHLECKNLNWIIHQPNLSVSLDVFYKIKGTKFYWLFLEDIYEANKYNIANLKGKTRWYHNYELKIDSPFEIYLKLFTKKFFI